MAMFIGIVFMMFFVGVAIVGLSGMGDVNYSPPKKPVRRNRSINTFGKYNQAKRYYGYAHGRRKLW